MIFFHLISTNIIFTGGESGLVMTNVDCNIQVKIIYQSTLIRIF